jgi:hypothetical protein
VVRKMCSLLHKKCKVGTYVVKKCQKMQTQFVKLKLRSDNFDKPIFSNELTKLAIIPHYKGLKLLCLAFPPCQNQTF